jgi:hypothetical protein
MIAIDDRPLDRTLHGHAFIDHLSVDGPPVALLFAEFQIEYRFACHLLPENIAQARAGEPVDQL